MSQTDHEHSPMRSEPPLPPELTDELASFWEAAFGASYEKFRPVLGGAERGLNRNILYVLRDDSKLVGTTQLTISCSNPRLGGLGEVATAPSHRGRGIGGALSIQARDEFLERGGEALFLGTVNPDAARLYHRLGWRKLPSANVMCMVGAERSVEDFLVEYFRSGEGEVNVAPGSAACRIDMIPLILCPHDDRILDANVNLFSTRYAVQSSCMGLFPRYEALRDGGGEWFAARAVDGQFVGLATARQQDDGAVQIDGFVHRNFQNAAHDLLRECVQWADARGANQCLAEVARGDEQKCALLESLGFSHAGTGRDIELAGDRITTLRLSRQSVRS
jgi:GNAT superfamily N-acetyltransferase